MAVIKCKMCGGDLEIVEGVTVAECEYCGTKQTVPTADNEKKMTLFSRANRLRLACEFDKAAGIYESIVAEFPTEAEAYWGLVLCRYGIEYVDDPATGKKIPTCHRSSFDSIMEDADFEQSCENADPIARRVYRDEAKAIEDIRKGILEVSGKEEPYDIFICYKETAADGDRTLDSVIAQDVYDALTEKGYRVFFSRISLEDKLGAEYEPYIFAALNSAKIMLAFGTDHEYFNAVWVKNEWSRFLALIAAGQKKTLIPCYKGIDAYDMPKQFARLQAQDMGKVGAIQDLLRGIGKIIPRETAQTVTKETVVVQGSGPDAASLLKRGKLFLADKDWKNADECFDKALDIDPECGEAYWGKMLAENQLSSGEQFVNARLRQEPSDSKPEKLEACPFDLETVNALMDKYTIPGYLTEVMIYGKADSFRRIYQSVVCNSKRRLKQEKQYFEQDKLWNRAMRYATGDFAIQLKSIQSEILTELQARYDKAKQQDEANIQRVTAEYAAFMDRVKRETEEEYVKAKAQKEADEAAARKKREEDEAAARAALESERSALQAKLPTIKGLFSGGKRKQVEARLAEIENELKSL